MEKISSNLMTSNPREIALVVLSHLHDRDTDATRLLHDLLRRGGVHGTDARLATELALGILRRRSRLDAVLETMTRRSWKRTPPPVRDLLRLGAYQILFMDRIPAHAAVNESVVLARRWATAGQAALVNAILRRLAENKGPGSGSWDQESVVGSAKQISPTDWPRFYSHPPWLVKYLLTHYPAERMAALLEWNNRTPLFMLRANRLRTSAEQLAARLAAQGYQVVPNPKSKIEDRKSKIGWPTPETLTLSGAIGDVASADWFHEGLATVQDGAAQLIAHFVASRPNERIVDWCAAPGGKTTHLAELSDDRAHILALDIDAERLAQVAIHAERLGLRSVKTYSLHPDLIAWLGDNPADAILVDAPCTGLGTIQRHPDIRWRRRIRDLERSARLQGEILETAARCVARGGRLIYSTCTLGPVENERVIEGFLSRHPHFERAGPGDTPDPAVRPFLDECGDLRTWPPEHGVDGFYAAKLIHRR